MMSDKTKIEFHNISIDLKEIIFAWLAEPHVQEFWDNSQEHKDDILNFMNGRKEPSSYANGQFVYFVAKCNDEPYAMIMAIEETPASPINEIKIQHLSKTGRSYSLDFMIGNKTYLGKGMGAPTLVAFMHYFRSEIDKDVELFMIDPASDNPRAMHIYMKAGFEYVGDFVMEGPVSGAGQGHHLLIKKF